MNKHSHPAKFVLTEAHCYHPHLIVEPAQFMLSHVNFHIDIIIKALRSKNKIAVTHLEGTFFPKVNDTLLFMKKDGITYELSVTVFICIIGPIFSMSI